MKQIHDVLKNNLCCGCGGCILALDNLASSMKINEKGFLRPFFQPELSKQTLSQLLTICPGVNLGLKKTNINNCPNDTNYDLIFGKYINIYVANSNNKKNRFQGSSGGILTEIACHLLRNKIVDGIFQVGADPENPLLCKTFLTRVENEVLTCAGSRYAPSSPLCDVGQMIKPGEKYAFIGKPCDISAINNLFSENYLPKKSFPVLLSFFCAGIPSQKATEKVVLKIGLDPARIESFRYRGMGWPGGVQAISKDGIKKTMTYKESWGKILSKDVQFRCKVCWDGIGEESDIVAADAWYGEDGYPDFSEREGRSLVITRTKKGNDIFDNLIKNGLVLSEKTHVKEIYKMQPGQLKRKKVMLSRVIGAHLLLRPVPKYNFYTLLKAAKEASIIDQLKNMIGIIRRILYDR
jgi:coenzyme F420 hydrogenase subunit beta